MAQKLDIPSREDLEARLLSHQGNINKLSKDLGVAWSTARAWLIERDLIEVSRNLTTASDREETEQTEGNDKNNCLDAQEAAEPVTSRGPCPTKSPGEVILAYQEEIEYSLCKITEKLNALEQKVDQLQTAAQVEFRDVAELAQKMHQVWIDARRD